VTEKTLRVAVLLIQSKQNQQRIPGDESGHEGKND